MAKYPIKMLKDENGLPFVPLTHVSAVSGEEYTTAVLIANKIDTGHYQIVNDELDIQDLQNKVIAVNFDEIGEVATTTYLKINNSIEYPLYKADGVNLLLIRGMNNATCFFTLDEDKWKLITIGSDEASGGGHAITNSDNEVMTQRGVLNFDNMTVEDVPGIGATRISPKTKYLGDYPLNVGSISLNTWTTIIDEPFVAQEDGLYRMTGNIILNEIASVGREIIIDSGDIHDVHFQYRRGRYTYTFVRQLKKDDSFYLRLYVDRFTSTDSAEIKSGKVYIEKIN